MALKECFRVLEAGGVLRITDDDNESLSSKRFLEPWHETVTGTGPAKMRRFLEAIGFQVFDVARDETHFKDNSLIQAYREETPPYYFFIEGLKPSETADRQRR